MKTIFKYALAIALLSSLNVMADNGKNTTSKQMKKTGGVEKGKAANGGSGVGGKSDSGHGGGNGKSGGSGSHGKSGGGGAGNGK